MRAAGGERGSRAGLGWAGAGLAGQRVSLPLRSGEAVLAERRAGGEEPCELRLQCRPGAEMVSVGIVSQARNMEVYVGEEYCGTGRGQSRGTRPAPG